LKTSEEQRTVFNQFRVDKLAIAARPFDQNNIVRNRSYHQRESFTAIKVARRNQLCTTTQAEGLRLDALEPVETGCGGGYYHFLFTRRGVLPERDNRLGEEFIRT
jgi:hypothetical protein